MTIQFDPELLQHIRTIYGNANLDGKTLKQIHQTWQTNPDIIRNTARQKMPELNMAGLKTPVSSTPKQLNGTAEIADDDFTGVKSFGAAFKEARKRGLKQFKWGKGVYGTQLASSQKTQKPNLSFTSSEITINTPNVIKSTKGKTWGSGMPTITGSNRAFDWLGYAAEQKRKASGYFKEGGQMYQQGGTMNNQEELQKAFVAYLIQDAAAQGIQLQSEQDLQAYAEQLGEEGIKAKYQEFMQKMQGGVMARLGAKLQYYKKLKGECPEGEELVYFKQGGRICKACQKAQKGTKVNAVDKFKAGRAQFKKDMNSTKDEAAKDSIAINKYNDQEVMANKGNKGNFKNGKWVPDRSKYTKK